jgi:hypothetical protein
MSKSLSLSCPVIVLLSLATALHSVAQSPTPGATPPGAQRTALTCRDFHKNPDGTWSPNAAMEIAGVRLFPMVGYRKGQVFGGLPLVDALEESCVHPAK